MTNKKHNYDWDAMGFDPGKDIYEAFTWDETPQGWGRWYVNAGNPEGQAEFDLMKRLYAEDMAAKEGPVRTVTRKEIVPGKYGNVTVWGDGWPSVKGVSNIDELTDAIETLTQIRDALDG